MRQDNVNDNPQDISNEPVGITWEKLIDDANHEVKICRDKITRLRKSIVFFATQQASGVPFPTLGKEEVKRHQDFS